MSPKKYTKLTPTQEYEKYMRATDAWIKKEMTDHAAEIEVMLQKMEASREQR